MLFNPIKTVCEWKQFGGNWMSHSICCPHATANANIFQMLSPPSPPASQCSHVTVRLSSQSATVLERRAVLHWVMLFIKHYRNPVAGLSGQCISSSSITVSATPACCYLLMFGDDLRVLPKLQRKLFEALVVSFFQLIILTWRKEGFKTREHQYLTPHPVLLGFVRWLESTPGNKKDFLV